MSLRSKVKVVLFTDILTYLAGMLEGLIYLLFTVLKIPSIPHKIRIPHCST